MFFSTAQNSFWTCQCWCHLVLLPFSASLIPYWQNVSLWGLFSFRKTRKSRSGQDQVNRKGGVWGTVFFGQNCWTLTVVRAGALVNHSSWDGQTYWKSLQKIFSLKPNAASHNNSSWCTDTDGFLEHSPSGGSLYHKGSTLQKIIPVFGGSPLRCVCMYACTHKHDAKIRKAWFHKTVLVCSGGNMRVKQLLARSVSLS